LRPIAAASAVDDANMQLMDLDAFWGGLFNFPSCFFGKYIEVQTKTPFVPRRHQGTKKRFSVSSVLVMFCVFVSCLPAAQRKPQSG
jgi:hypothetical protein